MFNIKPVLDALLATPYARVNDEEHLYIRCPFCGDSQKHLDKPHCGIWVKGGQPLIYHCWICEESGVVNNNFLQQVGITNPDIVNHIGIYNHEMMKNVKHDVHFMPKKKEWNVQIPMIHEDENAKQKLAYMQQRLGINFTFHSMEVMRIIFSINDFLALNGLKMNPDYYKMRFYLNRDYIGFLSTTKDMLIMRSIKPDTRIRYIKYPIFPNNPFANQLYVLPTVSNVFDDTIDLHLCEGTFDILGVFFHVMNRRTDHQIYAAVGGSAYRNAIKFFLQKGFLTNLNLHIYSDRDKPVEFYERIIKDFRVWLKSIHIYYNQKSKDTGVPKEWIQEEEVFL